MITSRYGNATTLLTVCRIIHWPLKDSPTSVLYKGSVIFDASLLVKPVGQEGRGQNIYMEIGIYLAVLSINHLIKWKQIRNMLMLSWIEGNIDLFCLNKQRKETLRHVIFYLLCRGQRYILHQVKILPGSSPDQITCSKHTLAIASDMVILPNSLVTISCARLTTPMCLRLHRGVTSLVS